MNESDRYMGIDFGGKRVGIALSDPNKAFALPHAVLLNDAELIPTIIAICRKENVSKIILGESRNYKGEPNAIMKKVEVFKTALAAAGELPVEYEPELMTSREASHIQGEGKMLDASAAALILKSYLESDRNKK